MIHFVITEIVPWAIGDYLLDRGGALVDRLRPVTYRELARGGVLPPGTYVFSDLDRLLPAEQALVERMVDRLCEFPERARIFNDPRRVKRRFQLLETMHEAGINRFRAFRVGTPASQLRFPVFLREEVEHTGSLTRLIRTPRALQRAFVEMRLRGFDLNRLLIVEYCNTADEHGVYRKYSAFIVGDRILARQMFFSRRWMVKSTARWWDDAKIEEERVFVENNEHEPWLRDVFRLAGTDYGRIDYGFLGDAPQIWEINLNARVGRRMAAPGRSRRADPRYYPLRETARDHFYTRFQAAWEALDQPIEASKPISLDLEPHLLPRLGSECERRQRALDKSRRVRHLPGGNSVYRRGARWAARLGSYLLAPLAVSDRR